MKLDDVFLMAKKAGFTPQECLTWGNEIQRLASLVAAHEREECAKAVENVSKFQAYAGGRSVQEVAAAAIRQRGSAD